MCNTMFLLKQIVTSRFRVPHPAAVSSVCLLLLCSHLGDCRRPGVITVGIRDATSSARSCCDSRTSATRTENRVGG
jgi:hypothetical protein